MRSDPYFAMAGPCGSGKTSLLKAYLAKNPNCTCIEEIEPHPEIRSAERLNPETAQRFQEEITRSRSHQIAVRDRSRILIVDRTFEEDREVFLPLYRQLGFLSDSQVRSLRKLSLEAENSVGSPALVIRLAGSRDVFKQRLDADAGTRPPWLLESFDIHYDLYTKWDCKAAGRVIVLDVSNVDIETAVTTMEVELRSNLP